MNWGLQPVDGAVCRQLKIRTRDRAEEVEDKHVTGWMSYVVLETSSWQNLME